MADLSQFRALLADHDDTTIAGMAGCSPEDVAAFRAARAPAAPPAAAPAARAAPAQKADKKADKKAAEPAPPPPLPRSVASYVAELSLDDATALYEALHARLHPEPVERPAPHAVKLLRTASLTGVSGRPATYSLGDVYSGEIAAHLWAHHRDAVRAYPS